MSPSAIVASGPIASAGITAAEIVDAIVDAGRATTVASASTWTSEPKPRSSVQRYATASGARQRRNASPVSADTATIRSPVTTPGPPSSTRATPTTSAATAVGSAPR